MTKQKLSTVSQTYLSFAKVVSGIICNASSIHPKFSNMYEGSDGNVEVFCGGVFVQGKKLREKTR